MSIEVHLEEYRLVQGKIDKIGEFRFIVRGWAVTLAIAVVATAELAKLHPIAMLLAILALGVFAAAERREERLAAVLRRRAQRLEAFLMLTTASALPNMTTVQPSPQIARGIARIPPAKGMDRVLAAIDDTFYICLSFIILTLFVVRLLLPVAEGPLDKPAVPAVTATKTTPIQPAHPKAAKKTAP